MIDYDSINSPELIKKAKEGDRAAQSILVEKNSGLVWSIVKRFQNRGYEAEDLFQIGSMGLIKAIRKFDSSYNVRFSTYAVPMIIGEIKRFLRDDGLIKVSRSLKEISNRAHITREHMQKELGREPTVIELAEKLDVEKEELVMAIESSYTHESLYSIIGEGDSSPTLLIDRIDSDGREDEIDLTDRIALQQIIDTLDPREKQIIVLRYYQEKTQTQIAQQLGISQVQVSRIEKRVLRDMRRRILTP